MHQLLLLQKLFYIGARCNKTPVYMDVFAQLYAQLLHVVRWRSSVT